jgi:hypothetical protein
MAPVVGTPVADATGPGTSLVVSYGTEGVDWNPGDTVFVLASCSGPATDTFANVTDWTTVLSARTSTITAVALYYRVMVTGDPTTMTILTIATNRPCIAVPWVDSDLTSSPVDVAAGAMDNSSTGSGSLTLTGITAGTSKRLLAVYGAVDNAAGSTGTAVGQAAFTHDGTMTELFDACSDVGADVSAGASYQDTVTGATGTRSVTGTPNSLSNYRAAGFLVSLNLSGGGGTDATVDADADNAVADGAAASLTHSVTASSDVAAVPADSLGQAPLSGNETSAEITAPAATGAGDVPIPAVSSGTNATVDADTDDAVADGAGDAPAPSVTATADVTSPVADGAGDASAPTVAAGATVTTGPADAAGDVPAPAVSGSDIPRLRFGQPETGASEVTARLTGASEVSARLTGASEVSARLTGGEEVLSNTGAVEVAV